MLIIDPFNEMDIKFQSSNSFTFAKLFNKAY